MRSCYVPRFDFHVAASDYIATEVRRLLPERLRDRLHVCPMGVDFEAFRGSREGSGLRKELLRRLGADEGTVLLLYAGRLSKEKNLSVLPAVLGRLAERAQDTAGQNVQAREARHLGRSGSPASGAGGDFRLIIAGDGPFADELRESLEDLVPGRSLFLGHCQREELQVLYHAADVFLHTNPREPFGIAPLEAMAAGLALVAPASGGVLTYANTENAWLTGRSFHWGASRAVFGGGVCQPGSVRVPVTDGHLRQRGAGSGRFRRACDRHYARRSTMPGGAGSDGLRGRK
jgi:glycosyltransferase involved in cell wall biosynthesis